MSKRANSVLLGFPLTQSGKAQAPLQITGGSVLPCNLVSYQDFSHLRLHVCSLLHGVQILIFLFHTVQFKGSTVGLI